MSHLLIIELPGGNDSDIVQAAIARGDEFTFLTSQLAHYQCQPTVQALLQAARGLVEVPGFDEAEVERRVLAMHAQRPFDAVLCLVEIRLPEAARLARRLGLPHLNCESAELLRDKFAVRLRLQQRGLAQPEFALAESNAELRAAVERLGLPVIIKPADGHGSQNIVLLRDADDLDPLLSPLDDMLPSGADYGLGVRANDRLLVERFMAGRFIACDTFSTAGHHCLLGVHEKLLFDPPSFAVRGCTFTPRGSAPAAGFTALEDDLRALLDAVGFDWGAAHIEIMLTDQGPRLVEINPRLVGARIPRLLGYALGRSLHADLIALHTGQALPAGSGAAPQVAVLRWIVAEREGLLDEVVLPPWQDPAIRCVEILRQPGAQVRPPLENADRLGYVMVCGPSRAEAERLADRFVARTLVRLHPLPARIEFRALPRPAVAAKPPSLSSPSPWPLIPNPPPAQDFSKAAP